MTHRSLHQSLFVCSLFVVVSGCSSSKTLQLPSKGYYEISALGQLPPVPKGASTETPVSLVQANGDTPTYVSKSAIKLRAGDNMECTIKALSKVEALAEAGKLLLVQVDRKFIEGTCANSGQADFVEGYVERKSVEIESTADSAPSVVSETRPRASEDSVPSETPRCENLRYGSYLGKNKVTNTGEGKSSSSGSSGRFSVNNQISLSKLSDNSNRMPGSIWREGGGNFVLLVKGSATRWKVQAINKTLNQSVKNFGLPDGFQKQNAEHAGKAKMEEKSLKAADLNRSSSGEYEIPFTSFVTAPNTWRGDTLEITVKAEGSEGVVSEESCFVQIRLQSPLVLDFSGKPMIETVSLAQSDARFDLNADGVAEQTGWVNGKHSAFLVLDLNGNGNVDSGRELFGDSTLLSRSKAGAPDGFTALAQYDTNADGKIDPRDLVFSKLQLWFDRNQDGRSDTSELVSLKSRGIEWISVAAAEVPTELAFQHSKTFIPNDVRFASTFAAKGCPKSGCRIYDVFFGSVSPSLLSKRD